MAAKTEDIDVADGDDKISTWLPPCMFTLCDTEMRMTFVDGAFQLYGHEKRARHIIRSMKASFRARYDLEDHPEDMKVEWSVGEACIAKFGEHWHRAQIIEMDNTRRNVAVIYVDLGNVREVDITDLRIPRAFANQPILAIRMVLESINPPNGDRIFSDHTLEAIQEEIGYWNAGYVMVENTREVSSFPIPVKLYLMQKKGESEGYDNFGGILLKCGIADEGEIDLLNPDYKLHARIGHEL